MRSLGKLLGPPVAAALFVAISLPAIAANKTITLSVTPVPAPLSSQTTVISALISNTGNSNANSFEIDWTTSPYLRVISATADGTPGDCSLPAASGAGYSSCIFLKQLPTKTSVTITLNVEVTNECNSMSIGWEAYAWTGSPGSVSQSFELKGTPQVTTSLPNCTVSFVTQPASAFVGSAVTSVPFNSAGAPVTVLAQRYGKAWSDAEITLGASPTSCATPGAASVMTDSFGKANLAFTAAGTGACMLTAAVSGSAPVESQSFTVVQYTGTLDCGDPTITAGSASVPNEAIVQGVRLANVDASACRPIPYTLSSQPCITAGDGTNTACKTTFVYDPLDQNPEALAFFFTWSWPLETLKPIASVPPTKVTFSSGNTTTLDACVGSSATYTDGTFESLTPPPTGFVDQDASNSPYPSLPGVQAACLLRREVQQSEIGIYVGEDGYIQGDIAFSRN